MMETPTHSTHASSGTPTTPSGAPFTFTATSSSTGSLPRGSSLTPSTRRRIYERHFSSPLRALKDDPREIAAKGKEPSKYFGRFLIMSVLEKNDEDLKVFLDKGADPNYVDPDEFTPLIVASKHKVNECAKILVSYGAEISKATKLYESPLQFALKNGNQELVSFFLEELGKREKLAIEVIKANKESGQPEKKRRKIVTEENNGSVPDQGNDYPPPKSHAPILLRTWCVFLQSSPPSL